MTNTQPATPAPEPMAPPRAYECLAGPFAHDPNTNRYEFDGDTIRQFEMYRPLTPASPGICRPGAANLWFDAADHGQIQSVRHAIAIVRAEIIRTEWDTLNPLDAEKRHNFDADYSDAAAIAEHVLNWAYMFESPGFDAEPRDHRVSAAWAYLIYEAGDYLDQSVFLDGIRSGEIR